MRILTPLRRRLFAAVKFHSRLDLVWVCGPVGEYGVSLGARHDPVGCEFPCWILDRSEVVDPHRDLPYVRPCDQPGATAGRAVAEGDHRVLVAARSLPGVAAEAIGQALASRTGTEAQSRLTGDVPSRISSSSVDRASARYPQRPCKSRVTTRKSCDKTVTSDDHVPPRTVNKARQLVCAIFNYGCGQARTVSRPIRQLTPTAARSPARPARVLLARTSRGARPSARRRRTPRSRPTRSQRRRARRSRAGGCAGCRTGSAGSLCRPSPRRARDAALA